MNIKLIEEKRSVQRLTFCISGRINQQISYHEILLFKNGKNSLFIRNSINAPMKDQEKEFNGFDHNTDDGASENENSSTPTKENMNDNPKDSF